MTPPKRTEGGASFPTLGGAVMLTVGAIAAEIVVIALFGELGPLAAQGLGTALGIGFLATLAARRVPDPQAQRLGFAPFEWRAWPLVLGLVPTIFLASELDNFAYDLSPKSAAPVASEVVAEVAPAAPGEKPAASDASTASPTADPRPSPDAATTTDAAPASGEAPGPEVAAQPNAATSAAAPTAPNPRASAAATRAADENEAEVPIIDFDDPFAVMEGLIAEVGIAPVIHEFLFRGVVQQGLVAQLGVGRGVAMTALLWTMLRPVPSLDPARFVSAFVAWLAMGWLLGMLRIGTGSLVGPILLASVWSAVGFASSALASRYPILGMNVEGTHLPVPVTIASLAAVTWAIVRVSERVAERGAARAAESGGESVER